MQWCLQCSTLYPVRHRSTANFTQMRDLHDLLYRIFSPSSEAAWDLEMFKEHVVTTLPIATSPSPIPIPSSATAKPRKLFYQSKTGIEDQEFIEIPLSLPSSPASDQAKSHHGNQLTPATVQEIISLPLQKLLLLLLMTVKDKPRLCVNRMKPSKPYVKPERKPPDIFRVQFNLTASSTKRS